MAKTKAQKIRSIEAGGDDLKKSETVVLVDFTGIPVNKMNEFRRRIRTMGAGFRVIKKRLLKIVFEKAGLDFNPKDFEGQTGAVFSPKDAHETSAEIYKFSKEEKDILKILGGFSVKEKSFLDKSFVVRLGSLPGREMLLSQLVGMFAIPIKKLLYLLEQKSKQTVENK